MKIDWNKKYTTYAIYAALVLVAVILCIFLGVYIGSIWNGIVFVANVFAPLFYGFVIAYLMMPLLNLLEKRVFKGIRHGVVRRGFSVTLSYLFVFLVLGLLVYAVFPQIARSTSDLQTSLVTYSESLQNWVNEMVSRGGVLGSLFEYLNDVIDFTVLSQPITYLIELLYELMQDFSPYIMNFLGSFVVQLKNIILGFIFAGYIMYSKELVLAQVNKIMHVMFSRERITKIKRTVSYTDKTFGKYLMGALVDALVVGVLTAIAMLIFRIPYVPLISVIIACTNVIPIFGPFIGAIPSVLFIFISSPIKALIFIIIILVIQQIDGNFIAPRVLGSATGLPAIGVITAITVMGGLFGIVGMVIGVPVFAVAAKFIHDKTEAKINAKRERAAAKAAGLSESDTSDTASETNTAEPETVDNAVSPEPTSDIPVSKTAEPQGEPNTASISEDIAVTEQEATPTQPSDNLENAKPKKVSQGKRTKTAKKSK